MNPVYIEVSTSCGHTPKDVANYIATYLKQGKEFEFTIPGEFCWSKRQMFHPDNGLIALLYKRPEARALWYHFSGEASAVPTMNHPARLFASPKLI